MTTPPLTPEEPGSEAITETEAPVQDAATTQFDPTTYSYKPPVQSAQKVAAPQQRRLFAGICIAALLIIGVGAGGYFIGNSRGFSSGVDHQKAVFATAEASKAAAEKAKNDDRFEKAHEYCDSPYAEVGDDGRSLILQSRGEEQAGMSVDDLGCYLGELDIPDSVLNRLNNTRALDGMQEATWDGIDASWTFHPDSGLNITLTMEDE